METPPPSSVVPNGAAAPPETNTLSPPELPVTPQSNNKGLIMDEEGVEAVASATATALIIDPSSDRSSQQSQQQREAAAADADGAAGLLRQSNLSSDEKSYTRNMSALSVSTGEIESAGEIGIIGVGDGGGCDGASTFSYEEDDLPETPKSSLVSTRKQLSELQNSRRVSNITLDAALNDTGSSNTGGAMAMGAASVAVGRVQQPQPKAVDWIPQQSSRNSVTSGVTSQSVKMGDDVTETSFTTLTTAGDMMGTSYDVAPPSTLLVVDGTGTHNITPTPIINNVTATSTRRSSASAPHHHHSRPRTSLHTRGVASGAAAVRSPRPPRHMRAVDWCPPNATNPGTAGSGSRVSGMGSNTAALASDKTAVTSRAVRLGDDATVTTFATMTTMGDAGSILEADTEDEASHSTSSSDDEGNNSDVEVMGQDIRSIEEEQSMEDVQDEDGAAVVDKIPRKSNYRGSLSGTTNHAVKVDDQSVVTFATMTTVGGMLERGNSDVVDKVPSFPPRLEEQTSIVTNDTVQMGDNQSLATWATTNTMGGQLTGNVVDHVPSSESNELEQQEGVASSSNVTVGTSNAVKEDPSITTFTTAAMDTSAESAIDEVVDKIPTFAGGAGRSVMSGLTNQAVRMYSSDDRSVASFATMTTMGDLGSIFETDVLEEEDDHAIMNNNSNIRPRLFSGEIDRAVVDVIPEATSSVASGTTNHSVRTGGDSESVTTFGTMTTAGRGDTESNPERSRNEDSNLEDDKDVVDQVPASYPNEGTSIVSGTTNHAVRLNDDQSVATWATAQTSGVVVVGHINEHVVDKLPSFKESRANEDLTMASETTNDAFKDPDDQSVVTWNTMTTAGGGGANRSASSFAMPQLQQPPPGPYAVDRVPSFRLSTSVSGTTNHAYKASDDQSVVTFATMTTVGGMDRGSADIVDKVPSFAPLNDTTSIVTNDTVQMGDNQSLATWATTNTMGGQLTGYVVDHVPSEDEEDVTVGTTNAIKEDPSVTTFTTSAAMSRVGGINEVVDKIPTFAGGAGRSVVSGITNQAVRMGGDDRSVMSFATMTTAGDLGSTYETDNLDSSANSRRYSANSMSNNNLVDRIPSSSDRRGSASVVSGRTDNAVRLGDDLTVTTFATMTTAGGEGSGSSSGNDRAVGSDQSAGIEENDALSGNSISSSSRVITAPPTAGILRESRHSRPSALRSLSDSAAVAAASSGSAVVDPVADLPINAGESVSNTHILRAISDLRFHVDYRMGELRELNRRDSERVLQIVQQDQTKRTALEARLHSQLLLQSESMVAMELKLLRLEAKAAQRDSRLQRRQPGIAGGGFPAPTITDRLPPIAATPSTPNRSDEEVDSFEELELTPRANRSGIGSSSGLGLFPHHGGGMHRGGGPANIAVVTRSGASVASAVTATSFQEGEFAHTLNDERSDDGDIEDEGDEDDNDDGSASTPTQSSRRISNLESILLNPIQGTGTNDQGISTRAVRGDTDGNSSLPTTVTSATMASTVITSTTRGNESVGITRISSRASEEDVLREGVEEAGVLRTHNRSNSEEFDERPRSRSQSPLTVQSAATGEPQSVASYSLGPSILSTAAVASSRSFGTRRANAAAAISNAEAGWSRSMANRVVSFTTNDLAAAQSAPPQETDGGGDSITMPDELDNFSDIADAFSNSARTWREEYEARLDAIHKRLGN